jgi:hypothetical protein
MKSDEAARDDAYRSSFEDFTEAAYVRAVQLAQRNYAFARFTKLPETRHVLWRHDVDYSMHRALRMAEIEAEMGVHSTYFVYLHSPFYNLLSALVTPKARRIIELGHDLGLHFDPSYYSPSLERVDIERRLVQERDLLADALGRPPLVVSFHQFGDLSSRPPEGDMVAGMINAYGRTIWSTYGYCSDSNGVWRHRRLFDVLERAEEDRLHILTHPEWWTPSAMSPRERIQRCLDGAAEAIGSYYDAELRSYGRPNIR